MQIDTVNTLKYNTIEEFILKTDWYIYDFDNDADNIGENIYYIKTTKLDKPTNTHLHSTTFAGKTLDECISKLLNWANNQHTQSIIE